MRFFKKIEKASAPLVAQKPYLGNNGLLNRTNSLATFSLQEEGAKKIAQGSQARRKSLREFAKKKRRKGSFALCGARGGRCPSTPQTFEKV